MLLQDIRYACRSLWHSKAFAVVAILCLGFGIGLNTTIFSTLDGVLLKPYPYEDPDRILVVGARNDRAGFQAGLSYLDLRDWNEANMAFTTIAASQGRSLTISDGGGEPERYLGATVSWDLFPLLGTDPILGRHFTPEEDMAGGGGVVLLGHDLWTRRYQGDPGVLGRTILIDARPHEVIGVMPPGFAFPQNQRLWVPLAPFASREPRDFRGLFAFGRLKPGVTIDRARQELDVIASRLAAEYPDTNEGWASRLRTLREAFVPNEVTLVIYLMMAGVTLVLFIACSNVANLLLARATSRRRELSVRAALGAGRGRIIRQLLTESVVLSLVSVPLGIGLAEIGTRLIASAMPPDQVPYYITWDVDWRSMVYTIVVAVSTALLFGLFPALQVSRGNLHDTLKEGTRGNSAGRSLLRSSLVVVQVSFALVSLVGALLFVRTFNNLGGADLGFDTSPVMTMRFAMGGEPYEPEDARLRRVEDVVRRIEAVPGVRAAFASNFVPLSGGGGGGTVIIDGRPAQEGERSGINFIGVTPHVHQVMGLPILRGRDFTDAEGWSRSAVAVINDVMAARFWPDREAIGGRFRMAGSGEETVVWFTVIGITRAVNLYGIDPEDAQPPAAAFVPYAYQQTLNTGLTVRVAGDPASITSAVRGALRESDPNLPMFQARTMDDARRLTFWQFGLYGWIFGTTGVMGLLLAAVGVYGVLSYAVSQRTQEIGVRVALGAGDRHVLRLVVGHGLWLAGIGVLLGLALAPGGTWAARSFFYDVGPFDPLTFTSVALFLLAVAFLASYVPARRALKVDPMIALRAE
ncbi:MAG TPA: ABC transporter permease [Vicinamibacterales bacterium]|nr:ABC transporter permease [Vicinamibacterales bacterium]